MILRQDSRPAQGPIPESANINLYVRMPDRKVSRQPPSPLAQLLGLHLYSDVILDKSTRTEMSFAAIIIAVVSIFEFLAWGFLFNAIFNSDVLRIGWGTIPAVLIAFLFASAIFWFERQFLTYDESQRGRRTRIAALVRGIFILTSAFITAQPVELLFFRIPIEKRIHQEGIREQAAAKLSAVEEENARGGRYGDRKSDRKTGEYHEFERQIGKAREERSSLQEQLVSTEGEQAARARETESYRRAMESAVDLEAKREAERAYYRADALRAAAARKIPQLRIQIADLGSQIQNLGSKAVDTRRDLDKLEDELRKEESARSQRLRNWIEQLKVSEPGKPVDEEWNPAGGVASASSDSPLWGKPWHYEDPEYDFFEQIQIVWNLALGKPPGWRNASNEIREQLERGYQFATLKQSEHGWQLHLLLAIAACHMIALFIPFLVLCIKLVLMPPALRRYYSSRHQAEAGDHDAWLSLHIEEQVNDRNAEPNRI
jgi:hypothetical protein